MIYRIFRLFFQSLQHNFFGYHNRTHTILKITEFTSILNEKYINGAYKCDFTVKRGTPNGTQNNFSKNIHSELFSNVSSMGIVILHQKLHTAQCL